MVVFVSIRGSIESFRIGPGRAAGIDDRVVAGGFAIAESMQQDLLARGFLASDGGFDVVEVALQCVRVSAHREADLPGGMV